MEIAPDGRIFVCLQGGSLRVIKNGALLPTPFLTLNVDPAGERGLLGIAFDPNFATNNFLYLYYTVPIEPRHNRVSRFTANGDVVVPGSETIILELDNLSATRITTTAARSILDLMESCTSQSERMPLASNAQTLSNRLGKMLRINSNGTIPTDNPFFNTASGVNRSIWALGLRNPFTFAFQPGTGRMFINDVGASAWEEINDGIAGSNYGWPNSEGATAIPGISFTSVFLCTQRSAARLPEELSTIRRRSSFRRALSGNTFSLICAAAGFDCSILPREQHPTLRVVSASRSI